MDKLTEEARHALNVTLVALTNSTLQLVALALYAWAGDMPWPALAAFAPLTLGIPLLFALLLQLHRPARLTPSQALSAQALLSCGVQLVFVVAVPQLSVLLLVGMLVQFNLLMLGMSRRQLTLASVALALAAGAALWWVRDRFRYPSANDLGLYALWLYCFLAVRQLTVVGLQPRQLQALLSRQRLALSETVAQMHEQVGRERLRERERIARELHDTLLQGVHGLMLQFQSAAERVPPQWPARRAMEEALDHAERVVVAGRDRLNALQSEPAGTGDLATALRDAGRAMARDFRAAFRFELVGTPVPLAREDAAGRLCKELLLHAFQREAVREVAARLRFGAREAEFTVLNDGDDGTAPSSLLDHRAAATAPEEELRQDAERLGARLTVRRIVGWQELRLRLPRAQR